MKLPNFNEEKKLWRRGYKFVAGLDEAGRGPLAGPVVAAAVCIKNPNDQIPMTSKIINPKSQKLFGHWSLEFGILGINDSKQLSPKRREQLYDIITMHPNIKWGIGIVSEKIIDKINILEATKLAMVKATKNLESRIHPVKYRKAVILPKVKLFNRVKNKESEINYLILDGNFKIKSDVPQKSIIRGDQKVISVSAASIIAKVTRDRIMLKYDKKYPEYGFKKHKGYPTKFHRQKIKELGFCKIHRRSFRSV